MKEKAAAKDSNQSESQIKKKNRGTTDELQILTQIITENNALLHKVLEKVYAKHPEVNPKNNPSSKKIPSK